MNDRQVISFLLGSIAASLTVIAICLIQLVLR